MNAQFSIDPAGLPESKDSEPYSMTLSMFLNKPNRTEFREGPGGGFENREEVVTVRAETLTIDVELSVTATVVASQSVWTPQNSDSGYCDLAPGISGFCCDKVTSATNETVNVVPTTYGGSGVAVGFIACDVDGLRVNHYLPNSYRDDGTREFQAFLSDGTDRQMHNQTVFPLSPGEYQVFVDPPHVGTFTLSLSLVSKDPDNPDFPATAQVPGSRTVVATCPSYLVPYGGGCVCRAGTYLDESSNQCLLCDSGTWSTLGSATCDICAERYYLPLEYFHEGASSSTCDTCDEEDQPIWAMDPEEAINCSAGTTGYSLWVQPVHWRMSNRTRELHRCKSDSTWSPCLGGTASGEFGEGYCHEDHKGPRCEVCVDPHQYFDESDARCKHCFTDVSPWSIVLVTVLGIAVASTAGIALLLRRKTPPKHKRLKKVVKMARKAVAFWHKAGLRSKLKLIIGCYQCLAMVPIAFNVEIPYGLEDWVTLLEFANRVGIDNLVPGTCLGNFERRLIVSATWPIGLALVLIAWSVSRQLLRMSPLLKSGRGDASPPKRHYSKRLSTFVKASSRTLIAPSRSWGSAARQGVVDVVPFVLMLTFLVLPATANRIFSSLICETFSYDENTEWGYPSSSLLHSSGSSHGGGESGGEGGGGDQGSEGTHEMYKYLVADLSLSCDGAEYSRTLYVAYILMGLWPVGVPLLYMAILFRCRASLAPRLSGLPRAAPTRLSVAAHFLYDDYRPEFFWWEPFEMVRKLTLTGFLLLQGSEQGRVLIALMLSLCWLTLHNVCMPYRRGEDNWMMLTLQVGQTVVYLTLMVLKTCEMSEEYCGDYGLGKTARDIFIFFVYCAIGLLSLLVVTGLISLYYTGHVPKLILVARSHMVPVSVIFRRVLGRHLTRFFKWLKRWIGLRRAHFDLPTYAAIVSWKATHGREFNRRSLGDDDDSAAPAVMRPALEGEKTELHITHEYEEDGKLIVDDVLERTRCFVRVDPAAFALHWTRNQYISLHSITSISMTDSAPARPNRAARLRQMFWKPKKEPNDAARQEIPPQPMWKRTKTAMQNRLHGLHGTKVLRVRYGCAFGKGRWLYMTMPAVKAEAWLQALKALCATAPLGPNEEAHFAWSLSCMEMVRATALVAMDNLTLSLLPTTLPTFLRWSDLSSLLDCANISLADEAEVAALRQTSETAPLAVWRTPPTDGLLNAQQVHWMLLKLATSQKEIEASFQQYAPSGRMRRAEFLAFVRAEQQGRAAGPDEPRGGKDDEDEGGGRDTPADAALDLELQTAGVEYDKTLAALLAAMGGAAAVAPEEEGGGEAAGIGPTQFAQLLLSPSNDAVGPPPPQSLAEPLAHYWCACSHNSYIVGDQLTGDSTAEAYARQLLQGCRHVEIDCWDGRREPVVTHGFTFVSLERFTAVAKAVRRFAFATSELPVVLSLEMHCSLKQQEKLAQSLVDELGGMLVLYDQVRGPSAATLSPDKLRRRVLVKCKVKTLKQKVEKHNAANASPGGKHASRRGSLIARGSVCFAAGKHALFGGGGQPSSDAVLSTSPQSSPSTPPGFERGATSSIDAAIADPEAPKARKTFRERVEGASTQPVSLQPGSMQPGSPARRGAGAAGAARMSLRGSMMLRAAKAQSNVELYELTDKERRELVSVASLDGDGDDEDGDAPFVAPGAEAAAAAASGEVHKAKMYKDKVGTARALADISALRAVPYRELLADPPRAAWSLPISSINEDKLLQLMGLSDDERNDVEGLQPGGGKAAHAHPAEGKGFLHSSGGGGEAATSRGARGTAMQLAREPTPETETMQRLTRTRLVRVFPLGLRFSGNNMNPLPCWLAGAQHVALNMCNVSDGLQTDPDVPAAWSKWPSCLGHSWPPRAPQTASEGVGLPFALVGRGPASQTPPRGRGLSYGGHPSCQSHCV